MNHRTGARAALLLVAAFLLPIGSVVGAEAAEASGNGVTTVCDVTAGPLLAAVDGSTLRVVYTINNTCFSLPRIRFDSHIKSEGRDHITSWQVFPHGEWTYTQYFGLRSLAAGSYVASTSARFRGERIGYGDMAFSWAGEG
jgi:hypothetical protein